MRKYLEEYKELHKNQRYGINSVRLVDDIARTIPENTESLLDFGAGQSTLSDSLHKRFGFKKVRAYDPAVEGRNTPPSGNFDIVICTDVMEHVPEEEIDSTLDSIQNYSGNVIFMIALTPATQILSNGENAHCTVKPKEWWMDKIERKFGSAKEVEHLTTGWRVGISTM